MNFNQLGSTGPKAEIGADYSSENHKELKIEKIKILPCYSLKEIGGRKVGLSKNSLGLEIHKRQSTIRNPQKTIQNMLWDIKE